MNTNRTIESSKPLILLVFATDALDSLKTEVEMQSLQSILEPIAQRLDYEVQILEYSTIDHFIDCLDDNRDRLILLHFAGHSNSELLQLDEGEAHAQGLAGKLQACQYLQLLFLNGCSNAHQVQRFVEVGIPATIGTYYPINDSIACEFSEAFYTELVARQQPIASAFKQAKETISTKYGSKYHSLNVRSFGDENEDIIPKKWAWFLEQQIEEHDWEFEDAAHACNRLPILPPKTTQDLPDLLFKNLYYYQSSDADIFFGRCQATLDILTLLDNADYPLLLLHGGTGVGKSSFLMAGLIPRILARQQVVNQPFRYDEHISLENLLPRIFDASNIADIHFQLDVSNEQPSIWILDQVEEIFFQPEKETTIETPDNTIQKEERQDSIPDALNLLLKTLKALFPVNRKEQWPNARIIFTLRTEWFGELHDACRKYQLANQDYMLKPLDKADIIEIIEQPTKKQLLIDKYGLQIEKLPLGKLSAQIADDLLEDRESNIAPPLQIILSKLWQDVAKLPKQERIWTQQLYEQKKAQGLLLSEHLDHQLQEIGTLSNQQHGNWGQEANDSGLLIDILHSYTTIQGTSKTRSIDDYTIHYAHIPYRGLLARTFIDRYLLIDPSNERQQYRLAHDTLAKVVKAKYETSELPGQRARRLLDSRKTDWVKVDSELKGAALDKFDLKLVEIGETGTRDWHQDEIEVAIINKSQKKRRNGQFIFSGVILGFIVAFLVTALLYFQAEEQRQIAEEKKLEANYQLAKTYEQKAISAFSVANKDQISGDKSLLNYRKSWLYALEAKKLKIPIGKLALKKDFLGKITKISLKELNPERKLITSSLDIGAAVNDLIYSPDGKTLASATSNTIQLWDAKSGHLKYTFEGHTKQVNAVAYSPDGTTLSSASADNTLRLWDIKTGKIKKILRGHTNVIFSLAYNPKGTLLASGSYDKTIRLWDTQSGDLKKIITGHKFGVTAVAYSPNGELLASSSIDNTIRLWNIKSGKVTKVLKGPSPAKYNVEKHPIRAWALAFRPDGLKLASGYSNSIIHMWDVNSEKLEYTLEGHSKNIWKLTYSPDGAVLASASWDKTIRLWNAETGKLKQTLRGHNKKVLALTYSPDGTTIASGSSDQSVKLWDVKSGKLKHISNEHTARIWGITYNTDNTILASASSDGSVRLWDVKSGKLIRIIRGHSSSVNALAYSPDGKILTSASSDYTVKLWDAKSGKLKLTIKDHLTPVYALAYNSSGSIIATASEDKIIRLWNADTGELIKTLKGHTGIVNTLIFSPKGNVITTGASDKTIKLWDVESGELKQTLKGHTKAIWALVYNSNGDTLASASFDHSIRLWDVESGRLKSTLKGHTNAVVSLAYDAEQAQIISSSLDQTIRIWDFKSGQLKRTFTGHHGAITAITYNPKTRILASASDDKTIQMWDINTSQIRMSLEGHTAGVNALVYSPDGKEIASASDDKSIRLWNSKSGQLKKILTGHFDRIWALAYHPDGSEIASVSNDQTLKIWDKHKGKLKQTINGTACDTLLFPEIFSRCEIHTLAYSPDGAEIATGSTDQSVILWDTKSGHKKRHFLGLRGNILTLVYSPDGSTIAYGANETIYVINIKTGKTIYSLKGHKGLIKALVYSPNGLTLASASSDNTIKLWNTKTAQLKQTLKGHTKSVYALSYNPKGTILSSGSDDNAIRLWNSTSGQLIKIIEGHSRWVKALSYSPNGKVLASASGDKTIRLWTVDTLNTQDLFYIYDPSKVSSAFQFLWEVGLNKENLQFNSKIRTPSLLPNQGYYYSNTEFYPLLKTPKKGKNKSDQLVEWLQSQCAYQDPNKKKICLAKKIF